MIEPRPLFKWLGAFFSVIYLLFSYFVAVALVMALLSIVQIRIAMKEANVLTFEELDNARIDYLRQVEREYDVLRANDKLNSAKIELYKQLSLVTKELHSPQSFLLSDEYRILRRDRAASRENSKNCQDLDQFSVLYAQRDTIASDSVQISRMKELEEAASAAIIEIKAQNSLTKFLEESAFYEKTRLYGFIFRLPLEILTAFFVMMMGFLGSVISMTWWIIKKDQTITPRHFLLYPFIGSMSALVVLVFLKAGQIAVNSGTDEVPLDPFFVAFVGIVSGMLSERAFKRVSEIGTEFLKREKGDP